MHRDRQPHLLEGREVRHVISHESRLFRRHAMLLHQLTYGCSLPVFRHSDQDVFNAQHLRAMLDGRIRSAGDDGACDPCLAQQADPHSVLHVEAQHSRPVGGEVDAAVGQHTVNVQYQQLDVRGCSRKIAHEITP